MTKQDIIVSGILLRGGKALLAKRAITKRIAPGKYHLPDGHVEFGENPDEALKREFKEEFGLNIEIHEPVRAFSYVAGSLHTVGITYRISTNDDTSAIKVDPIDNELVVWAGGDELSDYLSKDDNDFLTLSQFYILK